MKRFVCYALTLGFVVAVSAAPARADTDTEVATVTADMALRAELDFSDTVGEVELKGIQPAIVYTRKW